MMQAFFKDGAPFIALVIVVVVGLILWRIPAKQLPAWVKTKDGQGVIKGVILAPLVIVVFAVVMFLLPSPARAQLLVPGVPGTWLNDGRVFAGIDYTRKQSPSATLAGGMTAAPAIWAFASTCGSRPVIASVLMPNTPTTLARSILTATATTPRALSWNGACGGATSAKCMPPRSLGRLRRMV